MWKLHKKAYVNNCQCITKVPKELIHASDEVRYPPPQAHSTLRWSYLIVHHLILKKENIRVNLLVLSNDP